ncbi:hypothetical protein AOLI_G00138690 [Acnodon oligacanthus]
MGTHRQTGLLCNMAGAPLPRNQKDYGSKTLNIKVDRGVQNVIHMENNNFRGPVRGNLRCSGSPGVGAGSGQAQQENAADGSINIINERGVSNYVSMSGNRCEGSVDIQGDINTQQPAAPCFLQHNNMQNNPVNEEDDEQIDLKEAAVLFRNYRKKSNQQSVQQPAAQYNPVKEKDNESLDT